MPAIGRYHFFFPGWEKYGGGGADMEQVEILCHDPLTWQQLGGFIAGSFTDYFLIT